MTSYLDSRPGQALCSAARRPLSSPLLSSPCHHKCHRNTKQLDRDLRQYSLKYSVVSSKTIHQLPQKIQELSAVYSHLLAASARLFHHQAYSPRFRGHLRRLTQRRYCRSTPSGRLSSRLRLTKGPLTCHPLQSLLLRQAPGQLFRASSQILSVQPQKVAEVCQGHQAYQYKAITQIASSALD